MAASLFGSEWWLRLICSVLQLFPTGDGQGRMVALNQPVTLAAMEGLFQTSRERPSFWSASRTSKSTRSTIRSRCPNALSFLTYRRWERRSERTGCLPARSVADEHRAAVLQLSHHGRAGHVVHRDRGGRGVSDVAGQTVLKPLDAVDSVAGAAVPVHRQHRRMDDRRTGPAAVAGLLR